MNDTQVKGTVHWKQEERRATPTFQISEGVLPWRANSWASPLAAPDLPRVGQKAVHPKVLRLVVLQLHNVLQSIERTPKVDLPRCSVSFALVLASVLRPSTKKRGVAFRIVAALLGMNPWNSKDGFLLIHPLKPFVRIAVDLFDQPVLHSLRTFVVAFPTPFAQFGGNLVAGHGAAPLATLISWRKMHLYHGI